MNVAPGISLQKLHTDCPFPLLDCISFSISLLTIIQSFHDKGVIHRDLKPENIHIDMNISNNNKSLVNAQITILDFGLSYIQKQQVRLDADFEQVHNDDKAASETWTKTDANYGNSWYRVPQLRFHDKKALSKTEIERLIHDRRSPTVDTSAVCAILFWLSTGIEPREREKQTTAKEKADLPFPPYHYLHHDRIVEVAKTAVQVADAGETSFSLDRCKD